jgi:hypothetical protein
MKMLDWRRLCQSLSPLIIRQRAISLLLVLALHALLWFALLQFTVSSCRFLRP